MQYHDCAEVWIQNGGADMKKKGKKKAKTEKEDGNGTGRTRKRVRYTPKGVLKRVVLIFAALYLACMGLSTVLVQQKFRQDHQEYLEDIADMVKRSMNEEISGAAARGEEITSLRSGMRTSWSSFWRSAKLIPM